MSHIDISGRPISVGDIVVYGAIEEKAASLRFGVVSRLKQTGDYPTIGVIAVKRDPIRVGKWIMTNGEGR